MTRPSGIVRVNVWATLDPSFARQRLPIDVVLRWHRVMRQHRHNRNGQAKAKSSNG